MNRTQLIQWLTTNCECWKGQGDSQILNGMSDEKLKILKEHAERDSQAVAVANTAVAGFQDGKGTAYRINPETGKWEQRPVGRGDSPVGNQPPGKKGEEDDEEDYGPGGDKGADEDEEDRKAMAAKNRQRIRGKTDNAEGGRRPQTYQDLLKLAPAHLREELEARDRAAQEVINREKDSVIAKILMNVAANEKPAQYERLRNYSVEELRATLDLFPKAPPPEPTGNEQTSTAASRSGGRGTGRRVEDDLLVPPTVNWEEVSKNGLGDATQGQAAHGVSQGHDVVTNDEMNYEEQLAGLPPPMRKKVQEANILIERERRRLIDDIVSNMDEDNEKRLRRRMANMELEDLRDFAAAMPGKSRTRGQVANYFGASGAPSGRTTSDADTDVLPLPTMNYDDLASEAGRTRRNG